MTKCEIYKKSLVDFEENDEQKNWLKTLTKKRNQLKIGKHKDYKKDAKWTKCHAFHRILKENKTYVTKHAPKLDNGFTALSITINNFILLSILYINLHKKYP